MTSSLDLLLPSPSLSQTEEDILAEVYSNPTVKKHLQMMALADTKELLGLPFRNLTDSELAKASATVQGKLAVLSTLLSIIKES